MATILFKQKAYQSLESESVLDTLLRHEVDVSYSCKNGICQACILKATAGTVPEIAKSELKPTLQAQGYFLACSCIPESDMTIIRPDNSELFGRAKVHAIAPLSKNVYQLKIQTANDLYYHAGQFLNIRRHDNLIRSYSICSIPQQDDYLELHIKQMENGKMSNWICHDLQTGDALDIQGPNGNCFYIDSDKDKNLLLIGTGTGLSPLLGIVRDALYHGHQGQIYLYHGSRFKQGLYLNDALMKMSAQHDNLHYIPCLSGEQAHDDVIAGRANNVALDRHRDLANWKVFLCGAPPMVNTTKKLAYLAGASLADIHADPFEVADLRKTPRQDD